MVLLPFDLRRSDLPLQIAFPILMSNSIDWLAPPQGINVPASVKSGEVIAMPAGVKITLPNNETVISNQSGFAQTTRLGIYHFEANQVHGAFAVNFSNVAESRILPNPKVQVGAGNAANAQPQAQITSQREFWNLLALCALALLLAEWWIYQRGLPTIRRR